MGEAMPKKSGRSTKGEFRGTDLAGDLEASANTQLVAALNSFLAHDLGAFYVHAGAAVELEVKAALARLDPLLILDIRSGHWDRDARRILSNVPLVAGDGVRTVGASDAVARLDAVSPRSDSLLKEWTAQVFRARNDVAHAGLLHAPDHESHARVASAFFRSMLGLRSPTAASTTAIGSGGGDDQAFAIFGDAAELVKAALSEAATAEHLAASRSLEVARRQYELFTADQQQALQAAAIVRVNGEANNWTIGVACVACGSTAAAVGDIEVVDNVSSPRPAEEEPDQMVILIFDEVTCFVCGLRLSGHELSLLGRENAAEHPTLSIEDLRDSYYDPSDDYDPRDHYDPRDYYDPSDTE